MVKRTAHDTRPRRECKDGWDGWPRQTSRSLSLSARVARHHALWQEAGMVPATERETDIR
jgi:hypothetical protein